MPLTIDRPTIDHDSELLEALRRGDAIAAKCLAPRSLGARAYRLATGITDSPQDAEEAVQDTFWNVIQKIETFPGRCSAGIMDFYRITANATYEGAAAPAST